MFLLTSERHDVWDARRHQTHDDREMWRQAATLKCFIRFCIKFYHCCREKWLQCLFCWIIKCSYSSSAGRAGRLVIGRLLVQIPAPGRAELHVSLSKILNPTLLISEALRWAGDLSREHPALALRRGWDWLQQQHPATPWKGISGYGQWHDMT